MAAIFITNPYSAVDNNDYDYKKAYWFLFAYMVQIAETHLWRQFD